MVNATDEAGTECQLYEGTAHNLQANAMTTEELQLCQHKDLCDSNSKCCSFEVVICDK